MIFRQLFDSASSTYSYLIASRQGAEALIIDPVIEKVDRYIQLLTDLNLSLVKVVDTHLHADHISGLGALRDRTHCITVMGEQTKADVVSMRVSDGDRLNIEGVSLGVIYTPGVAHSLLNGITRHTVMTLAKDMGIEVREISIPREMLYLADELFFTGTATEVAAIRSVDAIQIGNGKRGPITQKLQAAYFALVQGKSQDKHGWLDYVDMNAPRATVAG